MVEIENEEKLRKFPTERIQIRYVKCVLTTQVKMILF